MNLTTIKALCQETGCTPGVIRRLVKNIQAQNPQSTIIIRGEKKQSHIAINKTALQSIFAGKDIAKQLIELDQRVTRLERRYRE